MAAMHTSTPTPRGAKTGPRPRFDLEAAVVAASELGVGTFTLAQVAARLGISSPALYRVVSSRDELADLCMKKWVDGIRVPGPELPWQEQIRGFARALWEGLDEQPEMSLYMMEHPEAVRHIFPRLADLGENLVAGGFEADRERIAFALDFVADTVQGAHAGSQFMQASEVGDGSRTAGADGPAEAAGDAVGHRDDEGRAVMDEFMTSVDADSQEEWTYWTWTRRKIDFIIAGLEAGH